MISNRCARKSLVTNCNSIISKNYLRFLVDSNDLEYIKKEFAYNWLNNEPQNAIQRYWFQFKL